MSKSSFERVIAEQGQLVYTHVGDSMQPLIQPGDLLVIKKVGATLKKYDIPLYRRKSGQYVLHRIVGVRDDGYITMGDNRSAPEYGVTEKMIIGVLTDIVRDGQTLSADALSRKLRLKNALDLMYLISCALSETAPDLRRCRGMYTKSVLRLAAAQGLLSAAAFALEMITELPHGLDQVKKKAIRKIALFDIERSKILADFEKHSIRYCPLKGIILKQCYPKLGMREMSDNDILCDPSRMTEIKAIMEAHGYTCTDFGHYCHDSYTKPPTLEFEMHRALFNEDEMPQLAEAFRDIHSRLIGEGCARQMTDGDFYLYTICHMYKHHIHNGTGLRNLADIAAYTKHHDLSPYRAYLDDALDALGLSDFERRIRELALCLFSGGEPDQPQEELLLALAEAGVYGNEDTAYDNRIARSLHGDYSRRSKLRYYGRRIIPDQDFLKKSYPFVYRHRVLYPLLILYRPIRGILTHPKGILREIRKVARFKR